jgi:cell division protein FtsI/penicillin-binding protein 2
MVQKKQPIEPIQPSVTHLSTFLFISLIATSLTAGWWGFVRGPDLLNRTDNARRAIADRSIQRGSLLDRHGDPIVETIQNEGENQRVVRYPDLGPIVGYTHPIYGQSGLEASLDPVLRGVQGNDPLSIWWNHLLYGQPPPGLDMRLTLDLRLQRIADENLAGYTGSLILLNAENGEILVMASHPTFNPNQLSNQWDELILDSQSPLLNRVTQGIYPTGELARLAHIEAATNPEFDPISMRLPIAETAHSVESTPLEISLAAATLSNSGTRPAPAITQLMSDQEGGWLLLSPLMVPVEVMGPVEAQRITHSLHSKDSPTWQFSHTPEGQRLTWYLGGTTSDWSGLPLAVVVVLEEANIPLAVEIGQSILSAAMGP